MFFREAADIISQTLNPPLKTRQSASRQNSENDILVENWESLSAAFFEPVGEPTIIAYCYEEDLQLGDELPWWVNQFPSYSSSWMSELVPQLVPYVWHQRAPYNNQVPVYTNIDGQIVRAPIGCVALAMGTVMAYHRYPLQYDWMAITSYGSIPATPIKTPQKAVSKMLLDVANTVNTRWSIAGDGSGAGSVEGSPQVVGDLIKDGLQQLGYSSDVVENTSSSNLLDPVVLKENLQQGLPVIICSRGSSGGHAWVADGLISRNRYMDYSGWANYDIVGQRPGSHSVFIRERQEQVAIQIHYVWGWTNGQGNGWYYSFKPMNVTRDDITFTRYAKIMCANIKPTIK